MYNLILLLLKKLDFFSTIQKSRKRNLNEFKKENAKELACIIFPYITIYCNKNYKSPCIDYERERNYDTQI